ncbi:MAG: triose-phosphate isomerase [Bacteroidota bacterium]
MRKKIVAGNWKMNKTYEEAIQLINDLNVGLINLNHLTDEIIICPPALYLHEVTTLTKSTAKVHTASQNCHSNDSGAYTGEISVKMIKSVGATYSILGHSERRMYNHESDEMLRDKVNIALANDLKVIFCCGESLEVRSKNEYVKFVKGQLENSLFHLSKEQFSSIVIAYEPIWAIGTGVTASKEQAQEMHYEIRYFIAAKYGSEVAEATSILYGGSCNPKNAKELFEQADVDGGLIGGASLVAADFISIIQSF